MMTHISLNLTFKFAWCLVLDICHGLRRHVDYRTAPSLILAGKVRSERIEFELLQSRILASRRSGGGFRLRVNGELEGLVRELLPLAPVKAV